jgi:hypothetical protein
MKVRIKSHSVRFRLKGDDLERFLADGALCEETHIPTSNGESVIFRTAVRRGQLDDESRLVAEPYGLTLLLSPPDCAGLAAPENTGVYIRREWINEAGHAIRFVAYIEKDKKKRKHKDDEYKEHAG